jgi:hypothetical protein
LMCRDCKITRQLGRFTCLQCVGSSHDRGKEGEERGAPGQSAME